MWKRRLLYMVFFFLSIGLYAQEDKGKVVLDKEQWKALVEELEYPNMSPPETPKEDSSIDFSMPSEAKYFFLALIVMVLVYVIYLIAKNMEPSNKKLNKDIYELDDLEQDIHETDLEAALRMALEKALFNLAIRIQFLMIVKTLSETEQILWKAGKTNRAYLREMKAHPEYHTFYQLTRLYEKIWFGNEMLSELLYGKVAPVYQQFNQRLTKDEK